MLNRWLGKPVPRGLALLALVSIANTAHANLIGATMNLAVTSDGAPAWNESFVVGSGIEVERCLVTLTSGDCVLSLSVDYGANSSLTTIASSADFDIVAAHDSGFTTTGFDWAGMPGGISGYEITTNTLGIDPLIAFTSDSFEARPPISGPD